MNLASSWEPFSVWQGPRWFQKSIRNSMAQLPERFLEPSMSPISLLEASGMNFGRFFIFVS